MKNTFTIDIIPLDDVERLEALRRYRVLDTPRETVFDNMTCLASEIFGGIDSADLPGEHQNRIL